MIFGDALIQATHRLLVRMNGLKIARSDAKSKGN
jgi:hypothetical protein